ncbi:MAG: hypothetical protein AB1730_26720 [Myxococcota bacterium]|jgi:hypothetical protein
MSLKRAAQRSLALDSELNKERADALGRAGKQLELALEQCQALLVQLRAAAGRERRRLIGEYREARAGAEKWRWYLTIQREAMGLARHDDVERLYPTPPVVREE